MKKKIVWIVNEYNFPDAFKSRQTNLCRQLNLHGYDAVSYTHLTLPTTPYV